MVRDGDESYFTRILISRIVDTDWDKETGVGIAINELPTGGDGYEVPVYNYVDKTISLYSEDWNTPSGIAEEPFREYDRDVYLAEFAVRGVGAHV
jgi:hypothetical protein